MVKSLYCHLGSTKHRDKLNIDEDFNFKEGSIRSYIRGFRSGPTQTGLYSHRRWLEALNFGFRKQRDCTIRVAKTKALISFVDTAKLICVFVFAYAKSQFSHNEAHMSLVVLESTVGFKPAASTTELEA